MNKKIVLNLKKKTELTSLVERTPPKGAESCWEKISWQARGLIEGSRPCNGFRPIRFGWNEGPELYMNKRFRPFVLRRNKRTATVRCRILIESFLDGTEKSHFQLPTGEVGYHSFTSGSAAVTGAASLIWLADSSDALADQIIEQGQKLMSLLKKGLVEAPEELPYKYIGEEFMGERFTPRPRARKELEVDGLLLSVFQTQDGAWWNGWGERVQIPGIL